MKLSAPKKVTWWIAMVIGSLGIISKFITILFVGDYAFWFVSFGFALLVLATYLKGL